MEKTKRNVNNFSYCKELNKITPNQILTEEIQYAFLFYVSGAFKQLKSLPVNFYNKYEY